MSILTIENGRASAYLKLPVCLQNEVGLGSKQLDKAASNSGQPASSFQAVSHGSHVAPPMMLPAPSSAMRMAVQVTASVSSQCTTVLLWL